MIFVRRCLRRAVTNERTWPGDIDIVPCRNYSLSCDCSDLFVVLRASFSGFFKFLLCLCSLMNILFFPLVNRYIIMNYHKLISAIIIVNFCCLVLKVKVCLESDAINRFDESYNNETNKESWELYNSIDHHHHQTLPTQ